MPRWLFLLIIGTTLATAVFILNRHVAAANSDADFRRLTQQAIGLREQLIADPSWSANERFREIDERLEATIALGIELYDERDYGFYALIFLVPLAGWAYLARLRTKRDDEALGRGVE